MKRLVFSLIILSSLGAFAAPAKKAKVNLKQDFESLASDQAMIEKAKQMDPENKVRIVQNRKVDRNGRLEIGANYGLVAGGDSYYTTQSWGVNSDFHFTNRISLGVRYANHTNKLTAEGEDMYRQAAANEALGNGEASRFAKIDYPTETVLGVLSFYPLYGKINVFDLGTLHFDVYGLGGYGKTILSSGASDTITAGGGIGFWLAQHVSMRIEGRYQTYQDHPRGEDRQVQTFVGFLSLGVLL